MSFLQADHCSMGIGWTRPKSSPDDDLARLRWAEAASSLTQRYRAVDDLPLPEAVETVFQAAPEHWSREELAARIARARDLEQPPS